MDFKDLACSLIASLFCGSLAGCFRYVPVEVTVIDSHGGQAIVNAEVKPEYIGGLELQLWPDRSSARTDSAGKAVVRVTENPSGLSRNGHMWTAISIDAAGFKRGGATLEYSEIARLRMQAEREGRPVPLVVTLNRDE